MGILSAPLPRTEMRHSPQPRMERPRPLAREALPKMDRPAGPKRPPGSFFRYGPDRGRDRLWEEWKTYATARLRHVEEIDRSKHGPGGPGIDSAKLPPVSPAP